MLTINLLKKYITKFNNKLLHLSKINNNIFRIDTKFYDRHNDSIIVYVININNNIKLTDGGYTLDDLKDDGVKIKGSKRRELLLVNNLASFSIKFNQNTNEIYTYTSLVDVAPKLYLLIQSMLFANDMFMLSRNNVKSVFKDDVSDFFKVNNIRVTKAKFTVKSGGMTHYYDYFIKGSNKLPDRFIRLMSKSSNDIAKVLTMDVLMTRKKYTKANYYIFINDSQHKVDKDIYNLFNSEHIQTVPYTKRKKFISQLKN